MPGHRGPRPEKFLLRDIPATVRRNLAFCLDQPKRNDWKALARELHISEPSIRKMDEMSRGSKASSPTISLLKEYERLNAVADVEQLFILLGRIEQGDGMLLLSRFVDPSLHGLMPRNAHHMLRQQQGPVPHSYPGQRMMRPQPRLPLEYGPPLNGGHVLPPHGGWGPRPNCRQPFAVTGPHPKGFRAPLHYPNDPGHLATSPDSPYYEEAPYLAGDGVPREDQFSQQESGVQADDAQPTRAPGRTGDARAGAAHQPHRTEAYPDRLDEFGRPSHARTNGDSANQQRHEHARQEGHGHRGEGQSLGLEAAGMPSPLHAAEPTSTLSVNEQVKQRAERAERLRLAAVGAPPLGHDNVMYPVAVPPGTGMMHGYLPPRDPRMMQSYPPGQHVAQQPFSIPLPRATGPSAPEETRMSDNLDHVVPPPVPSSMQHLISEVENQAAPPPQPNLGDARMATASHEDGRHGHFATASGSDGQDIDLTLPASLAMDESAIPPGLLQLLTFKYTLLHEKTKGFEVRNSSQMLGQGGFGTVYKVNLNGSMCAVKKLSIKSMGETPLQGFQSMAEFQRELQTLLSVRCNYLVTLMGYSEDGPEPCLVYEYMENGSLEDWLFEMSQPRCVHGPLTGSQRLSISGDVSKALRYLHHSPSDPVIHCNVKSSNILLGQHMNAKLADFGHVRRQLSASCNNRTALSTRSKYAVRASTYMDPDMYLGKLDPKVDIYGFGVVLLEMLTGLKAYDEKRDQPDLIIETEETLYCRARDPQRRRLFIAMCDETLGVDLDMDELMLFGDVTASCLDDRAARPGAEQLDRELFKLISMRDLRLQS